MISIRIPFALCIAAAALVQGLTLAADATPNDEVAQRIRARLDAYGQRDARAWAAFVSDDCFCAGETKSDIVRSIEHRPPAVKNWFGEIRDLQTHLFGDVATARYRIAELTELDGKRSAVEEWRTETHLRRDGEWLLIAAADNPIAADPEPIVVSRRVLERYVGTYEYTPGSVDKVTLEGDRLFVEPSGEPKAELFAENKTTFFAKGQPWRMVFSVDAHGKATGVTFRQQGQQFVAKRLP